MDAQNLREGKECSNIWGDGSMQLTNRIFEFWDIVFRKQEISLVSVSSDMIVD